MNARALDARVLISIDQAEELFGVSNAEETNRLLSVLSNTLAHDGPYLCTIALRSDYLTDLQRARALDVPFEEFSFKPMPLERVPELITGPARPGFRAFRLRMPFFCR
jgi:hypothetical protein